MIYLEWFFGLRALRRNASPVEIVVISTGTRL
jgi:hypothetical protein